MTKKQFLDYAEAEGIEIEDSGSDNGTAFGSRYIHAYAPRWQRFA